MLVSKLSLLSRLPLTLVAVAGILASPALSASKNVDLSRMVVVGDSLSAGYQNSQLIETSQVHGYANVIATQAGVDLNLPLLPAPGFPQINLGPYPAPTGITFVGRRNNDQTRNIAVPGFTIGATAGFHPFCTPQNIPVPFVVQVLASEILNPNCLTNPGPSQLEEAMGLVPTAAILWIGSNDALLPILFGPDATDLATFGFLQHVTTSLMANASGTLVVANIPDVTLMPYLTSLDRLAGILGVPAPAIETVFGVHPGDLVTPYAFALIQGGSPGPLPDFDPSLGPVIIRAAQVAQLRALIAGYNAVIAQEAAASGAVLVDIHSVLNDLAAHGAVVGGQKLTTDFMGGLFSYDGVHPTNTGYAILANEFIKAMNRNLAAGIPPISIEQVAKTDPLIFPASHPGKRTGHVEKGMADVLRAVMAH